VRYGVTAKDAKVDASLMDELPTNPAIHSQAFKEDPKFWIDNGDKIAERWTRLGRHEVASARRRPGRRWAPAAGSRCSRR
jgi:hypothetical protein